MMLQKMCKPFVQWFAAGACLSLLSALPAEAAEVSKVEKESTIHINQNVIVVSGRMSLGLINGQSNEKIYVQWLNHKISELNWDISGVYMMGLGGSVAPLPRLKFNADVWFKLNDGDGRMEDYDWFVLDYQYTHFSRSDNLDLTRGVMFDVNSELTFYEYLQNKFYGILGFKYDTWKWTAYGGYYIYSSYYLYDTVGDLPDVPGITYEQDFYAPYLGLGFSSTLSQTPITFSGRLIYSPYVWGEDKDQHHLRNLVFEADFDSGTMFGVDAAAAYNFTRNFSLTFAYHYQKYEEMENTFKVTDLTTGIVEHSEQEAGMDHYSHMLSLIGSFSF